MNNVYITNGRQFRFNDHVCAEMLLGVSDEKRTGRLVQVRKGVGAFGTDKLIVRLRDGSLMAFENVLLRHVDDKEFERAFYLMNNKIPPAIPPQPCLECDTEDTEYSIVNKWPEIGFIIEHPRQPKSDHQSFGMMIISPK